MIKCPHCGSEHVSIISETHSEQTTSKFFKFILNASAMLFVLCICIFFVMTSHFNIEISDILIVNTLTEITSDFIITYAFAKISITLIIVALISGTILSLMPFYTYSKTKCICHECETEWERENNDEARS